ncbi:hypothetical protein BOTBODRAFT_28467 [Botryobasidium botryosum FD-172 SS1]|uniref:Uncharacterized protein n=1 Tax=Botryobasidium botryosum (strain FD-172 SS1) TaxID=930990 RepID=A0A067MTA9_BOTB1|nr:hypothetical protein BOTBODRAFT_28467 [Botryobasidium botryosum FD-172 SS1]
MTTAAFTGHVMLKVQSPHSIRPEGQLEDRSYMLRGARLSGRKRRVLAEAENVKEEGSSEVAPPKQTGQGCTDRTGVPPSDNKSSTLQVPAPPSPLQLMSNAPYQPNQLNLTQHLQALHSKFWGQGDAARAVILHTETHQLGKEIEKFTVLNLGPGFETFFGGRSTILVREEYKRLITALSTPSDSAYGAGLIGQPGIGKSTFMHYLLVERVLSGRRTMFQCDSDVIYELDKDGVSTRSTLDFFPEPSRDWALVDISDSLAIPYENLDSQFNIMAFRPAPEGWRNWCESRRAAAGVVRPWTKHEIVYAGLRTCHPPLNADRLQEAFDNHGPSPRLCFCFAQYPQCMVEWERDTARTIAEVACKDHNLFATSVLFVREWDHPSLYHQVFLVDLSETGLSPNVSIITPLVVRLIAEEMDRQGGPKVWEEFDMFGCSPHHDSGRRIWASHSMSAIISGEARQTKLRCITRLPGADRQTLESAELTLPLPHPVPYDDVESWLQELNKARTCPTLFQPRVWIESAFDSILVTPNYITFFETTVSHHIGATRAGLYGRLDALVGALTMANLRGQLPSESCKWRLVFVVPKCDLTAWVYVPKWRAEIPEGDWKEHLDLFVLCPEVGVLEIKERPISRCRVSA